MLSTGKKKTNSDITDSSPDTTPAAKRLGTQHIDIPIYRSAETSMEPVTNLTDNETPNEPQFDKDAPIWARQIWTVIKGISDNFSQMGTSFNILEDKIDLTNNAAKCANDTATQNRATIKELSKQNDELKDKLKKAEAYSKKNDLIFLNVEEDRNENSANLMNKLGKILHFMDLDLSKILIDNIHRLQDCQQK